VANERCGSWYGAPSSATASNDEDGRRRSSGSLLSLSLPSSCYFKSTDGHVNTWDFSLKRLNLPLVEHIITVDGGCFVVDSSVRKVLPDSFSRTIPIWATVLNRVVLKYIDAADARMRQEDSQSTTDCSSSSSTPSSSDGPRTQQRFWDTHLYTPRGVVSNDEHAAISNLIDDRVETLFQSGAIVNPSRLIERLTKPLRVLWMNDEGVLFSSNTPTNPNGEDGNTSTGDIPGTEIASFLKDYFVIVCWNPSRYKLVGTTNGQTPKQSSPQQDEQMIVVQKHHTEWIGIDHSIDHDRATDGGGGEEGTSRNTLSGSGYFYTPGAADDHESWARHLTPALFWKNQEALLDPALDDDRVDVRIDVLVQQTRDAERQDEHERHHQLQQRGEEVEGCGGDTHRRNVTAAAVYAYSDRIGDTNLWIGSRRASRPPECWSGFDAILNVTNHEYDGMVDDHDDEDEIALETNDHHHTTPKTKDRFYLQLPVEEGKRDRTQLEQWMPVGLVFLIHHLQAGRRVLVHCAQGKDRSVAVALVFVAIACPLRFPLTWKPEFVQRSWDLSTLDNTPPNQTEFDTVGSKDSSMENDLGGNESLARTRTQPYRSSGVSERIARRLLENGGKELLLVWIHQQLRDDPEAPRCLADKDHVRIALHLIRQDREAAEPTRSTMQKIHRFLMSSSIYR